MKYITCFALLFIALHSAVHAQLDFGEPHFILEAGYNRSMIKDINSTLISVDYNTDLYNTTIAWRNGIDLGVALLYKFSKQLGAKLEVGYSLRGADFKYEDVAGLKYQIEFPYSYFTFNPQIKVYPLGEKWTDRQRRNREGNWRAGLNMSVGVSIGIGLNDSGLRYSADRTQLMIAPSAPPLPDPKVIEDRLQASMKGRKDFGLIVGMGHELGARIALDVRFILGVTDAIDVISNPWDIIPANNLSQTLQVKFGWSIPSQ